MGGGVSPLFAVELPLYRFQSSPGMMRRMNSSKSGTVKVVSPWLGLQIIRLAIYSNLSEFTMFL